VSDLKSETMETMAKFARQATQADYLLLGVKPGVTAEELRAIYKSLVKRWHPDRFTDNTPEKYRAEEKLKAINAAYSRLRSDVTAAAGQAMTGSASFRDRRPPRPEAPQQPRPRDPRTAPPHRAAYGTPNPARAFFSNLDWSWPIRRHRLRPGFVLLPVILLALLGLDTHRPPPQNDRPSVYSNDPPVAPPPLLSPIPEAQPPTTAIPQTRNRPPDSKVLERTVIPPAREGPRRPAGGRADESPFFTLGSLKHEVVRVQGKPHRVSGQTWVYGLSEVDFKEGRVWTYNNFDGSLHVKLTPSAPLPADQPSLPFSIGAHKDDVLLAQGTPSRVETNKWYYGLSEVTFKDGRVVAYNNFFNTLKVLVKPKNLRGQAAPPRYFTIGSNQDEVLAVQGTPTSIQSNLWSYELSDVWFHEGKVRAVNDFSNLLKFQPKD
jgi:hypothetical protein